MRRGGFGLVVVVVPKKKAGWRGRGGRDLGG